MTPKGTEFVYMNKNSNTLSAPHTLAGLVVALVPEPDPATTSPMGGAYSPSISPPFGREGVLIGPETNGAQVPAVGPLRHLEFCMGGTFIDLGCGYCRVALALEYASREEIRKQMRRCA